MGDLTRNISRHELRCKCESPECNVTILDDEPIIYDVQSVCDWVCNRFNVDRVVLDITSAARCYEYNRTDDVGSDDDSQHPRARAIDFKIHVNGNQVPPTMIDKYMRQRWPNSHGIGLYNTFNHLDTRVNKGRW